MASASLKPSIQTYVFVGNPNSGKTSLFNKLTGQRGKTANYAGVTVDQREGICYTIHGTPVRLLDLPGSYSLSPYSPDEQIAKDILVQEEESFDGIIYVADATKLRRSLYYLMQLRELEKPIILVLRMMDVANRLGFFIDIPRLESLLGCKVVACPAKCTHGACHVKIALSQGHKIMPDQRAFLYDQDVENFLQALDSLGLKALNRAQKLQLFWQKDENELAKVTKIRHDFIKKHADWKMRVIRMRYKWIDQILRKTLKKPEKSKPLKSQKLDRFFLSPVTGSLAFVAIMGSLFWSVFTFSRYPVAWINVLFNQASYLADEKIHNFWIKSFLIDGVFGSVGNVLAFLPQILILFFFLGLLETTGYLPRGAFLVERVLRQFGLQGKAFIPLLSCYGCTIPGILATRCIRSKKERLVTILIAPWMSCSARLPVYIILISLLTPPHTSGWLRTAILFGIYAVTTFVALLASCVLRKTFFSEKQGQHTVTELPKYQKPAWGIIFRDMCDRTRSFLSKAGTIILFFSILLWALMSFPRNPNLSQSENLSHSVVGRIGHLIEPALRPLGYDWKIGVGVLSSFAARETFISTMGVIYNLEEENEQESHSLSFLMQQQRDIIGRPLFSFATCLSLLLFFAFSQQCFSTFVTVYQETRSLKWAILQFLLMAFFAYLMALFAYQIFS